MKHLLRTALVVVVAGLLSGQGATQPIPPAQQLATKTFTPRTLYFMAPSSCSDGNDGRAPTTGGGHGPWCTPNHAVNCGDVILAAPGTYSSAQFGRKFGTVSNCPSTADGIDGQGGIYFAVVLCAGSDLTACTISTNGSGSPKTLVEWHNNQSNWAIEGFNLPTGGAMRTFGIRTIDDACNLGNAFKSHHVAAINNVVSNSLQAFGFNDCGKLNGTANAFVDYVAVVGMIAQNANQDIICLGAIDFVGLGNIDTAPGTHAFMDNNYGMNNQVPPCVSNFDGHAFYIDSPDAHLFTGQVVISNNIGYQSTRTCIALTGNNPTAPSVVFKIYNNTCFNDNLGTGTNGDNSEINLNTGGNNAPWTVTVTNNVSYVDHAHSSSGTALYALGEWFTINSVTVGAVRAMARKTSLRARSHPARMGVAVLRALSVMVALISCSITRLCPPGPISLSTRCSRTRPTCWLTEWGCQTALALKIPRSAWAGMHLPRP